MANQKDYPIRFSPRGLSDAWDSTDTFSGACRYLTNLIFAQTDPELVVARPGVGGGIVNLAAPNAAIWGSFTWGPPNVWSSGFVGATFISIQITIGNLIYGMVSASTISGHDVPFCYDLNAQQFIPVAGYTAANTPSSPATSGDWIPPTMAVIGSKIVVTHPGYSGLPNTANITASISGSTLTVTAISGGTLVVGSNITGTSVPANTAINGFVSGTFGGAGVYTLNNSVGSPISSEAMFGKSIYKVGFIDISNTAAPYYYAGDTGIFPLPSIPIAVANFNNRAYYACGNQSFYSDVLFPTQMTNAGQALTAGDNTPIIGYGGLPVETTSAGVVAALMVFKNFQIWQITGDAAITNSLAQNYLSLNVGSNAPRSIVQTPVGMIFGSIDGPYFVSPLGQVMPLTKDSSKLVQDVQRPFQNVVNPTRSAAGFTGSIYRICMQSVIDGVQGFYDYWFDVTSRRWNGPHTFQYDCVSQAGNYFVLSGGNNGPTLWKSEYFPASDSVYNDNGAALSVFLQSAMLPKTQNINEKQVIESTIELSTASALQNYTVNAVDDHGQQIGTAQITIQSPLPTWGNFNWGDGSLWSQSNIQPWTYQIPWSAPLVFKKLSYQVSASASFNLAIGTMFSKYRDTGYTNVILPWKYITPTPPPTPPTAPQNLTAVGGFMQTIESWGLVYNAVTYNLYWSLTPGAGINGTKISGITANSYTHIGLTNGQTYYYVVTAVNSAGESAPSNQASAKPNFASLYSASSNNGLYQYSRNASGQASSLSPSFVASGSIHEIAISPDLSSIYAIQAASLIAFSINTSNGLSSIINSYGSYSSAGAKGVMVSPDGLNVYVVDDGQGSGPNPFGVIYQYSRNPSTGALSPLSPAVVPMLLTGSSLSGSGSGYLPGDILTLPGGTSTIPAQIMVDTVNGSGGITSWHISNVGSYSVVPSYGFISPSGGNGSSAQLNNSTFNGTGNFTCYMGQCMVSNSSGTHIYVYQGGYGIGTPSQIGYYQRNLSTGQLSYSNGSSVVPAQNSHSHGAVGAIHPNQSTVYFPNDNSASISCYFITGGVPVHLSDVSVGNGSYGIAITPNGQYMYVSNEVDNTISILNCNGGGTPSLIGTISTPANPRGMSISLDGNYLYVALFGANVVGQYSIGSNGALTALSPATVSDGTQPWEVVAI